MNKPKKYTEKEVLNMSKQQIESAIKGLDTYIRQINMAIQNLPESKFNKKRKKEIEQQQQQKEFLKHCWLVNYGRNKLREYGF